MSRSSLHQNVQHFKESQFYESDRQSDKSISDTELISRGFALVTIWRNTFTLKYVSFMLQKPTSSILATVARKEKVYREKSNAFWYPSSINAWHKVMFHASNVKMPHHAWKYHTRSNMRCTGCNTRKILPVRVYAKQHKKMLTEYVCLLGWYACMGEMC